MAKGLTQCALSILWRRAADRTMGMSLFAPYNKLHENLGEEF